MLFYIISILVIIIDQISKIWVRMHMQEDDIRPFWDPYIHFNYYENSGAAFSSFQGFGRLFGVIAIVVVLVILYYRKKGELKGLIMEIGTGLLAGGALGNAIDRIWRGKVTDFIVLGSRHGIMNIADLAINLGVLFIVVGMLFPRKRLRQSRSKYF